MGRKESIQTNKTNNAEPDEIPPYVAFHLGLHCLPKYLFTGIQDSKGSILYSILKPFEVFDISCIWK